MNTDNSAEKESAMERLLKQLIPGIAGLLVVVMGAYLVWFSSAKVSHDSGDWGTLGDYFGGLMNPVISFATLLVAYEVWKQQRKELRQTKEALEDQAQTAEWQRKEQRFFDCLTVYQRLVDAQISNGTVGSRSTAEQGREALFVRAKIAINTGEVHQLTSPAISRSIGHTPEPPIPTLVELRYTLPHELRKRIGLTKSDAYCRGVLATLLTCENVLGDAKDRFLPLLLEQLTQEELSLLALFLLFAPDSDRYWGVAERTHLFANLDTEGVLQLSKEHLPVSCFERS
ncbi:hypothetical protein [Hydrogenophaga sp. SL48]|uniref:hypothetical protein n=1 Tax=Hydrogenophaga sp. SL48 TaxID=2806347 RepID=UPI001F2D0D94|nr:hypothetical protein [Hydrogenophaga sp. SL48]UJW79626.1 hypothetical protein IM738_17285 [Hydrogenophaga sp. SL48]